MRFGKLLGGAFLACGVLFASIDSIILFKGWAAYGLDAWDKLSYGTAAASIPWTIVGFPFVFWLMWLRGRWRSVFPIGVALTVYLILLVYSLIGAMGSIATQRGQVIAERKSAAESVSALKDQRERLKDQLGWTPKRRPAGTVLAAIEAEKIKRFWEITEHCRDINGAAQRSYCTNLQVLQGEFEAAKKSDELTGKIETLNSRIDGRAPVAEKADPMAATLAAWTSLQEEVLSAKLPIATPLVLLIGEMVFVWFGFMLTGISHSTLMSGMHGERQAHLVARSEAAAVAPPALPSPPHHSTLTRQRELAIWFFKTCTTPAPDGSLPESDWHHLYSEICKRSSDDPLPLAAFRRLAREYIPTIKEIEGVTYFRGVLPIMPKESAA